MNIVRVAVFAFLAFTAGPNSVVADEGDKYGFLMGSYVEPDSGLDLNTGGGGRLGLGMELSKWANFETAISSTRASGNTWPNLKTRSFGADLQLVLRRGASFEPYLLAGVEVMRADLDGTPESSEWGGSVGAGFRGTISGGRKAVMRFEYRYRSFDAFDLELEDNIFSLGIQVPFGTSSPALPAAPPVLDDDNDGVVNDRDRCPNTPAGVRVDANGCALDSDGDGVADHADQCPGTVRGAAVDENGCELDSDADGVVDRLDECPDSAPGAQVDIKGCEIQEEIRLPGVNFESNSDRLLPGAESTLNDAAATLDKNPEIKVEVAGHTDSDGAAEYNESLSARRAATVRDFLIGKGIAEDRLTTRGYGESQPITGNDTAEGKAANRRVVLRITER